jgi:CubicO group peptidase (beta-lactamase class C family)
MATKDIAKLGVLYLNGGEYEGKRLLSREFSEDAVKPLVLTDFGGYGLSFWMNDIGYNGGGAYNQTILVVPERSIVFAAHSFIGGEFDFVSIVKGRL